MLGRSTGSSAGAVAIEAPPLAAGGRGPGLGCGGLGLRRLLCGGVMLCCCVMLCGCVIRHRRANRGAHCPEAFGLVVPSGNVSLVCALREARGHGNHHLNIGERCFRYEVHNGCERVGRAIVRRGRDVIRCDLRFQLGDERRNCGWRLLVGCCGCGRLAALHSTFRRDGGKCQCQARRATHSIGQSPTPSTPCIGHQAKMDGGLCMSNTLQLYRAAKIIEPPARLPKCHEQGIGEACATLDSKRWPHTL